MDGNTTDREDALYRQVRELTQKLEEAKQALFVASATIEAYSPSEPQKALIEQTKAIAAILNGARLEDIAEPQRTATLRAVAELYQNYAELWKSFELEQRMQTTETTVRPTMRDVERLLLRMNVPYAVGRIVALVLQPADPGRRRALYLEAKEYLLQLLQQSP